MTNLDLVELGSSIVLELVHLLLDALALRLSVLLLELGLGDGPCQLCDGRLDTLDLGDNLRADAVSTRRHSRTHR